MKPRSEGGTPRGFRLLFRRKDSAARKDANMRKAALWAGLPAAAAVVGVGLWFTLIPGRSGAG
jgi:hypothetical protein